MNTSPDIVRLVEDWFAAASSGDVSMIDRHISPAAQTRLIGSDAGEWFAGGTEVATFLRGEVQGAGGNVTFTPLDTEGFSGGRVGWAATRLTIQLADGKRINPRWSAVFVLNEDDVWQFVQTHASIAVPNGQIGWTYD